MVIGHTFRQASIVKWIEAYNKLIDKERAATTWMSNPNVSDEMREAEFLRYKCEILEALSRYVEFFKAIGVPVEPGEKVEVPA